jgi:hypothetical protein
VMTTPWGESSDIPRRSAFVSEYLCLDNFV